eukprot:2023941-Amphidinium_carterae.1
MKGAHSCMNFRIMQLWPPAGLLDPLGAVAWTQPARQLGRASHTHTQNRRGHQVIKLDLSTQRANRSPPLEQQPSSPAAMLMYFLTVCCRLSQALTSSSVTNGDKLPHPALNG